MSFANIDVEEIYILDEYSGTYHLASGISASCNLRGMEKETFRIIVANDQERRLAVERELSDSGYALCPHCSKNS